MSLGSSCLVWSRPAGDSPYGLGVPMADSFAASPAYRLNENLFRLARRRGHEEDMHFV